MEDAPIVASVATHGPGPTDGRGEHAGMTLVDLMLSILGVALAFAPFWPDRVQFTACFPLPKPWWYERLVELDDTPRRICLALLLPVAARRLRFGGLIRPAEFLLVACAAPSLVRLFDESRPVLAIFQSELHSIRDRSGNVYYDPGAFYWHCRSVILWTFVVASLALLLVRRSGAMRWASALLVIVGLMSFAWLVDPLHYTLCRLRIEESMGKHLASLFHPIALRLASGLVPTLAAVAALIGLARRRRRCNWLEWSALALGLFIFITYELM